MKKCILLFTVMLTMASFKSQAQFDFILEGLGSLTSTFSGDGYVNTIQDLEAANRALQLIDESRCLLDNVSYGLDWYEDEIGFQCFEQTEIDLARAKLDNSTILIADQLYGNVTGAFRIFQGILGGEGDQNINSSINKGVVSDAIDDAIEALVELMQKKEELEIYQVKEEEFNNELERQALLTEAVVNVPTLLALKSSDLNRMKSDGEREKREATNFIDLFINILTILTFIGAGYTFLRNEQVSAQTIMGIVAALVALGVANALV